MTMENEQQFCQNINRYTYYIQARSQLEVLEGIAYEKNCRVNRLYCTVNIAIIIHMDFFY